MGDRTIPGIGQLLIVYNLNKFILEHQRHSRHSIVSLLLFLENACKNPLFYKRCFDTVQTEKGDSEELVFVNAMHIMYIIQQLPAQFDYIKAKATHCFEKLLGKISPQVNQTLNKMKSRQSQSVEGRDVKRWTKYTRKQPLDI